MAKKTSPFTNCCFAPCGACKWKRWKQGWEDHFGYHEKSTASSSNMDQCKHPNPIQQIVPKKPYLPPSSNPMLFLSNWTELYPPILQEHTPMPWNNSTSPWLHFTPTRPQNSQHPWYASHPDNFNSHIIHWSSQQQSKIRNNPHYLQLSQQPVQSPPNKPAIPIRQHNPATYIHCSTTSKDRSGCPTVQNKTEPPGRFEPDQYQGNWTTLTTTFNLSRKNFVWQTMSWQPALTSPWKQCNSSLHCW